MISPWGIEHMSKSNSNVKQAKTVGVLSAAGSTGLLGVAAAERLGKDPMGHTKYTMSGRPLSAAARTRVLRIHAKGHSKSALVLGAVGASGYGAGKLMQMRQARRGKL